MVGCDQAMHRVIDKCGCKEDVIKQVQRPTPDARMVVGIYGVQLDPAGRRHRARYGTLSASVLRAERPPDFAPVETSNVH